MNAPCINLCGHCVSTDKIGHFFEEGFIYHQVSVEKGDDKFAIGLGMITEGLVPADPEVLDWLKNGTITVTVSGGTTTVTISELFGVYGDFPSTKPAGMADLEANKAGLDFWKQLFDKKSEMKFDICDFVTKKWDEGENPNVKAQENPFK